MVEWVVELVVLDWLNLARPAQVLAFEIGFFKCQIIFYPSLISARILMHKIPFKVATLDSINIPHYVRSSQTETKSKIFQTLKTAAAKPV